MEIVPVIQRCVGRTNASTSITTTAAMQTMTSGAINDQLIIGIIDCAKKISRKNAKYAKDAKPLII
jgi:hypothetical protein